MFTSVFLLALTEDKQMQQQEYFVLLNNIENKKTEIKKDLGKQMCAPLNCPSPFHPFV